MKILSRSQNNTIKIGKKLARHLKGGEIIALNGEMGAGKTFLTKGIAKGLDIKEAIVSPTFSILNVYYGKLQLCHYDAYRLNGEEDALERGLDEFLASEGTVCVIEWAENLKNLLDSFKTIKISLKYIDENRREIDINGLAGQKL